MLQIDLEPGVLKGSSRSMEGWLLRSIWFHLEAQGFLASERRQGLQVPFWCASSVLTASPSLSPLDLSEAPQSPGTLIWRRAELGRFLSASIIWLKYYLLVVVLIEKTRMLQLE